MNWGPLSNLFPPTGTIAVGFGYAALHRDGKEVWSEQNGDYSDDELMTGAQAEAMAAEDPDNDWRIIMIGPLSERTYQRHAQGEWVLIKQGKGFA